MTSVSTTVTMHASLRISSSLWGIQHLVKGTCPKTEGQLIEVQTTRCPCPEAQRSESLRLVWNRERGQKSSNMLNKRPLTQTIESDIAGHSFLQIFLGTSRVQSLNIGKK